MLSFLQNKRIEVWMGNNGQALNISSININKTYLTGNDL